MPKGRQGEPILAVGAFLWAARGTDVMRRVLGLAVATEGDMNVNGLIGLVSIGLCVLGQVEPGITGLASNMTGI